ncbi:hypothetical protein KIW84_032142 [Lathyrus oleraceus]|uniref:PSII 6.1 kDa protein n=1 Tax=Pisum sativum TaxID=3888 RepID=A0A9D5B1U1_PEA|nr:hypothetical protein KIW84_032142 [Pisum sativum]
MTTIIPSNLLESHSKPLLASLFILNYLIFLENQPVYSKSNSIGLPSMAKVGGVRCSIEGRHDVQESSLNIGMGAAMIAAISAATLSSPAAMALVDERMSTEGTGLPFGLSDNLLGWILFGKFYLVPLQLTPYPYKNLKIPILPLIGFNQFTISFLPFS